MAIIFWYYKGMLLTHYVPKGVDVNSVYCSKVLCELKASSHCKWSDLRNEQIFFIHDNAQPYSLRFVKAFLDELGWFNFPHLAYLSDLVPSDFCLFPYLKDFLGGQHFTNDLQVKQARSMSACFLCKILPRTPGKLIKFFTPYHYHLRTYM